MKNNRWIKLASLLFTMLFLTSCAEKESTPPASEFNESVSSSAEVKENGPENGVNTESAAVSAGDERTEGEASELLLTMTQAIEAQYPEQTFSEINVSQADLFFMSTGDVYEYTARQAADGWSYIAAIRRTGENPLEGMSCGTGAGISGYALSQFDDGRILFMESSTNAEKGAADSGLSYIYDVLQQGVPGMKYMISAAERGVTVVPPDDRPFMKVSMMTQGHLLTEYIPLTEEEKQTLQGGNPVSDNQEWTSRLGIFDSREELNGAWQDSSEAVTERMAALASERCGFTAPQFSDIEDIVKAELSLTLAAKTQKEELANREDLVRLTKLLNEAAVTDIRYDREYNGILTLTKGDGKTVTVQLAADGGGFVMGSAVYCELSKEKTEEIWSVFSMVQGFRQYGSQISMETTEHEIAADAEELSFELMNRTGGSIHYSLSPLLYIQSEAKGETLWKQIKMTGGFCGTYSLMEEERITLSIPWKGIFQLEGAGTYKLEIQAIPEEGMSFPVSAVFKVK